MIQAAASERKFDFYEGPLIVQKLLDSGADVNAPGGKFGNALQAAVHPGMMCDTDTMEKILLGRGAEVNMQGGMYGTAFQSACARGNMKSVRLLLSYGAEVNAEGGRDGTALQAACANIDGSAKQHYDLACLLIDHGADVHVQGGCFGSAWHAAAAIPSWDFQAHETMKLLLDNGVNVNQCHSQHGTAVQVALEHLEMKIQDRIAFLLEHGADVNLGAGQYGFPLQSACLAPRIFKFYLNTDGLVYLLDNCPDINVNQTGGVFGTALQAAAYIGITNGLKLLLEKGADVNLRGGRYGIALNAAAVKGYWDIAEILLEAGAEVDSHLFSEIDEEWLEGVCKEDGCSAVERYRNFWETMMLDKNEVGEAKTI